MRIFNGAEIRQLFRGAGIREIRLFAGFPDGGRFSRHSRRTVAAATRPES